MANPVGKMVVLSRNVLPDRPTGRMSRPPLSSMLCCGRSSSPNVGDGVYVSIRLWPASSLARSCTAAAPAVEGDYPMFIPTRTASSELYMLLRRQALQALNYTCYCDKSGPPQFLASRETPCRWQRNHRHNILPCSRVFLDDDCHTVTAVAAATLRRCNLVHREG